MVKDPLGDPVCRITTGGPKENEQSGAHRAKQDGGVVSRAGAIEIKVPPNGPGISTHAYGGTRMGDNQHDRGGTAMVFRTNPGQS